MRLTDQVLSQCLYDPNTGLEVDPARDFGLSKRKANSRLKELRKALDTEQQLLWANSGPAILIWLQGPDCSVSCLKRSRKFAKTYPPAMNKPSN